MGVSVDLGCAGARGETSCLSLGEEGVRCVFLVGGGGEGGGAFELRKASSSSR